MVSIRSRVSGV
ncbi:hypothetical protein YPPY98_1507, partial [Yersinia pestis PY-98]